MSNVVTLRNTFGSSLDVLSIHNGVMVLDVPFGTSIQNFAQDVSECFNEDSQIIGLKAIKFKFNNILICVTPKNSTFESILNQYVKKLDTEH